MDDLVPVHGWLGRLESEAQDWAIKTLVDELNTAIKDWVNPTKHRQQLDGSRIMRLLEMIGRFGKRAVGTTVRRASNDIRY
jgi:hypothetical protein